jgi:hypothetical protein
MEKSFASAALGTGRKGILGKKSDIDRLIEEHSIDCLVRAV